MYRGSREGTAALLTITLSLALCASAWAQAGDEPTASSEPSTQQRPEEPTAAAAERNGRNDVNCGDFRFREDAQEFFHRQGGREGGDEDRLAEDRDGQACETLPSGATAGGDDAGGYDAAGYDAGGYDDSTPVGGVDSGYGPTKDADSPLVIGEGLGLFALLGFGIVRLRHPEGDKE